MGAERGKCSWIVDCRRLIVDWGVRSAWRGELPRARLGLNTEHSPRRGFDRIDRMERGSVQMGRNVLAEECYLA